MGIIIKTKQCKTIATILRWKKDLESTAYSRSMAYDLQNVFSANLPKKKLKSQCRENRAYWWSPTILPNKFLSVIQIISRSTSYLVLKYSKWWKSLNQLRNAEELYSMKRDNNLSEWHQKKLRKWITETILKVCWTKMTEAPAVHRPNLLELRKVSLSLKSVSIRQKLLSSLFKRHTPAWKRQYKINWGTQ